MEMHSSAVESTDAPEARSSFVFEKSASGTVHGKLCFASAVDCSGEARFSLQVEDEGRRVQLAAANGENKKTCFDFHSRSFDIRDWGLFRITPGISGAHRPSIMTD